MRGVSAQSLDSVLWRTGELAGGSVDLEAFADELFSAARAIDSSNQLVRALSDPGRDGDFKSAVVTKLFSGKVSSEVLSVIDTAARLRWSEQNHLLDAIEYAGVSALLTKAEREGAFDTVEGELFQFARLVEETPELSEAFDSTRESTEPRVSLVTALLQGRAHPITVQLARQAVSFDTTIKVPERLDTFAQFAVSRRSRSIGVVTSAVPLSSEQQERVGRILAEKYGRALSLNFDIDPDVIGGMQIAIGDDLFDASISGRIKDAHAALTS